MKRITRINGYKVKEGIDYKIMSDHLLILNDKLIPFQGFQKEDGFEEKEMGSIHSRRPLPTHHIMG